MNNVYRYNLRYIFCNISSLFFFSLIASSCFSFSLSLSVSLILLRLSLSRPSFLFYLSFLYFPLHAIFSLSLYIFTSSFHNVSFSLLPAPPFLSILLSLFLQFSFFAILSLSPSIYLSLFLLFSFYLVTPPFLWKRRQRPGRKRPKESPLWHWARVSAGNTPACAGSIYSYSPALSPKTSPCARDCAVAIKFSVFSRVFTVGRLVTPKFAFSEKRNRADVALRGQSVTEIHHCVVKSYSCTVTL